MATQSRLIEFEVMRGVAALQVLAVHYEYYFYDAKHYFSGPGMIRPFFPGAVGMILFFMLSGFVISYSYFEELRTNDHRAMAHYVTKRYFRLWPLHITTLCVFLLAVPRYPIDGLSLLANATLLHALFPADGRLFAYNDVSWSIGVEMVCYLLFIFICVLTRRLKQVALFALGVGGIYIGYQGFTPWTAYLSYCSGYVGCGFELLKYGSAFILGLSLFLSLQIIDAAIGIRTQLRYVLKFASFSALFLFVSYGYLKYMWINGPVVPLSDQEWLTISASWISLAFLARNVNIPCLRVAPLYWAGVVSYSIYLWHNIVVRAVDRLIGTAIAYPVSIMATLALAALSYRLIEQPPRRWLRRYLRMRDHGQ
jgi:exopolysaccharide production protein ExoZ